MQVSRYRNANWFLTVFVLFVLFVDGSVENGITFLIRFDGRGIHNNGWLFIVVRIRQTNSSSFTNNTGTMIDIRSLLILLPTFTFDVLDNLEMLCIVLYIGVSVLINNVADSLGQVLFWHVISIYINSLRKAKLTDFYLISLLKVLEYFYTHVVNNFVFSFFIFLDQIY